MPSTKTEVFLTALRVKELEEELKYLTEVKEPEVAKKIREARELGNLEENSSFDLYVEKQEFITSRIREIENLLASAKIIDSEKNSSPKKVVSIGTTVIVEVEGRKDTFTIVGVEEAAPHKGKISHESPVGKALIGSGKGQEVLVETEVYSTMYKIIDINK